MSKSQNLSTGNEVEMREVEHMFHYAKHNTKRLSTMAVIEMSAALLVLLLLSGIIDDGHRFIDFPIHPFWVIMLFIITQYGLNEAVIAAVLCSVFLLAGNMPEQLLTETSNEYLMRILTLPFMWIVTALVLGGIRTRQINERNGLQTKVNKSKYIIDNMAKRYGDIKQVKENLELKVASETKSLATLYEIIKSLETTDYIEAQAVIKRLVVTMLSPDKFSIFMYDGKELKLREAHGWSENDSYKTVFAANSPITNYILQKGSPYICIKNEYEEKILDGEGIIAGSITDKQTGKIFGMLKIEEIKFNDFGSDNCETFTMVCEWIAHIYANVEKDKHLNGSKIYPLAQ